MFTLETVGTSMSLLFSVRNAFPFSTYGEAFFILAQNVAILIGMYAIVTSVQGSGRWHEPKFEPTPLVLTGISVFDKNPSPPMLALGLAVGLVGDTGEIRF
jgi:hypothetical protein